MIEELLSAYYTSKGERMPLDSLNAFTEVFESKIKLTDKIKSIDELGKNLKLPQDVGELLFDLLLFNFFREDGQRLGEAFFDSSEWRKIEDSILDRGTELMNILLYLQECQDAEIKYSLDDYLDEYLIGEDDFEQEEHEVYEAILKNRDEIVSGDVETMAEISQCNETSELGDQLLPILLFFETKSNAGLKQDLILKKGHNPPFQSSFLAVLSSF